MKNKKIFYLILCISLLSCANPVGPTGGPKDTKPPIITKTEIDSSFEKKITFYFDENIKIKNSISLNPYTKRKKPKIKNTNKSITIFLDSLTTSINFSDAITDINENNVALLPFFLLNQDTFKIKSKIIWPKGEKKSIQLIGKIDSLYYSSLQNGDTFIIEGLPNKQIELIAFDDLNKNNEHDSHENVSFIISKPNLKDSSIFIRESIRKEIIYDQIDSLLYIFIGINKEESDYFNIPIIACNDDTIITKNLKIVKDNLPYNFIIRKKRINYDTSYIKSFYSRINDKDTQYLLKTNIGYQLHYKTNPKKYYPLNPNDSITKEIKVKKLGNLTVINDSFTNVCLKMYQKEKHIGTFRIDTIEAHIELPVGQYKYVLFQDLNNNLTLDSKDKYGNIINEPIFHYWFETSVHHKLENIITVNYQIKQEKNTDLPVNISSD